MTRSDQIQKQIKLRVLSKQVLQLNRTGSFCGAIKSQLIRTIHKLIAELKSLLNSKQILQIMGSGALLLGFSLPAKSQSFNSPVENPFGLNVVGTTYYHTPVCGDLDGDGDLDILSLQEYGTGVFYENIGSPENPRFATGVLNPFNLRLDPTDYVQFCSLGDIDGDGDLDLMVGGTYYSQEIRYYENTGTASAPNFAAAEVSPFNLPSVGNYFDFDLIDIDADGDLDIIGNTAVYSNGIQFIENIGTPANPNFTAPTFNPFGLSSSNVLDLPQIADVDMDGDFDLITMGYSGPYGNGINFFFYENTGNASNPNFTAPVEAPFGLTGKSYFEFHDLTDLDGDGDIDILTGDYYGNFQFYENTAITSIEEDLIANNIEIYPNPTTDFITVSVEKEVAKLQLKDLAGKVILFTDGSNKMDLSSLQSGAYLLSIAFEDGSSVEKRVVKN